MKKIILFFIFILIFSSFVSSIERGIVIEKDSFLPNDKLNGINEINSAIEELYQKQNINIIIDFVSKQRIQNGYSPKKDFYFYSLDKKATPSLNLFFAYYETGVQSLSIGFSNNCGWTDKGLKALISVGNQDPKSKDFWLNLIFTIDKKLSSSDPNYLKNVCNIQEKVTINKETTSCKYLFPSEEKNRKTPAIARVVFLFEGYDERDLQLTKEYLVEQISNLRKDYNLFNKDFNKFQFIYLDKSFNTVCAGNYQCYMSKMTNNANECSPDRIVILSNNDFTDFGQFGGLTGLSIVPHNLILFHYFSRDDSLFAHEFGHSFFGLADEYTLSEFESSLGGSNYQVFYEKDFNKEPNCAPNMETAKKWWGDLIGKGEGDLEIGYYQGCSYIDRNIRPTQDSVMRSMSGDYGLVSEFYVENLIKRGRLY